MERESLPVRNRDEILRMAKVAGDGFRCTRLAHECKRDGSEERAGARAAEEGDAARGAIGGMRGAHGLGGWVLVRFSRGKRRRGVRAASGWCIIDPSVCGLGKKRSLRLGPRKRQSNTPAAYRGEKETPPRRPISQTDIRNAFASYPACGGTR